MAMTEYSLADIAAATDGNGGRGFGGDGAWWLLVLFALLGGFGNNGFGGGYAGGDALYPWLNQAQLTTQGFADQNAVMALNGIQGGIQGLSAQLCNCCGDVQMSLANGFAGVEAGANARQMANMQTQFGLQASIAQGCSDNQLAIANQTSALMANQTANTQRILDKLCDQELFAERRENENLRQQLGMAQLAASQNAQNALIQQGFANEVDQLYNRLNTCPVPSMPVYGRTPIFTCQQQGCGCNC